MSIYALLFGVGAVGLLALTLMGFGHHGADHGGHGHHGGHVGDHAGGHHFGGHHGVHHGGAHGHDGAAHHGHGHDGHHGATEHHGSALQSFLGLFSPLGLFSMALGAGAAGLLAEKALGPTLTLFLAIAAAIGMNLLVVRPLFRLVLGFAGAPAAALEGSLANAAEAASRFDDQGRGVVRLTVDGQTVRLLARLEDTELKEANLVAPGDQLLVTEVDSARNTCRVTRL